MKSLALTFLPGLGGSVSAPAPRRRSLLSRIAAWHRVAHERRRLLDVDPRLLADMGLTPEDARREAMRPFWDVSPNR